MIEFIDLQMIIFLYLLKFIILLQIHQLSIITIMIGKPAVKPGQKKRISRPGLTEDEIEQLRKFFNRFDTEATGKINLRQLKSAMQKPDFLSKNSTIFNTIANLQSEGRQIHFQQFLDRINSRFGGKQSRKMSKQVISDSSPYIILPTVEKIQDKGNEKNLIKRTSQKKPSIIVISDTKEARTSKSNLLSNKLPSIQKKKSLRAKPQQSKKPSFRIGNSKTNQKQLSSLKKQSSFLNRDSTKQTALQSINEKQQEQWYQNKHKLQKQLRKNKQKLESLEKQAEKQIFESEIQELRKKILSQQQQLQAIKEIIQDKNQIELQERMKMMEQIKKQREDFLKEKVLAQLKKQLKKQLKELKKQLKKLNIQFSQKHQNILEQILELQTNIKSMELKKKTTSSQFIKVQFKSLIEKAKIKKKECTQQLLKLQKVYQQQIEELKEKQADLLKRYQIENGKMIND